MDEKLAAKARKYGYDLICKICFDTFTSVGASIIISEKVEGGKCWRCLGMGSKDNPVYRMVLQNKENVKNGSV